MTDVSAAKAKFIAGHIQALGAMDAYAWHIEYCNQYDQPASCIAPTGFGQAVLDGWTEREWKE